MRRKALIIMAILGLSLSCNNKDKIIPVRIDYKPEFTIPGGNDADILSNVNIIYKPESDAILNIREIENKLIDEFFEKPILNKDITLTPAYIDNHYFNGISSLLEYLDIQLPNEEIVKINELNVYEMFKIEIANMNIYIFSVGWNNFKLFMFEYDTNSNYYDCLIKTGIEKEKIVEILGIPTYHSVDDNIYIYESFLTRRQIVIFFENGKTTKVQLVSFDGE